jgi:cell shape-determining protein MreC
MPWSYASSRLAIILRRVRGRFGISAPQLAIRTHVPWRLRAFSIVILVVLLLALAVWVFDFGRQIAGSNRNEISTLQSVNAALEAEVVRLRGLLAASENDLQIEKAAQKLLTDKHSVLMEENTKLKEELAVLERLSKAEKR